MNIVIKSSIAKLHPYRLSPSKQTQQLINIILDAPLDLDPDPDSKTSYSL